MIATVTARLSLPATSPAATPSWNMDATHFQSALSAFVTLARLPVPPRAVHTWIRSAGYKIRPPRPLPYGTLWHRRAGRDPGPGQSRARASWPASSMNRDGEPCRRSSWEASSPTRPSRCSSCAASRCAGQRLLSQLSPSGLFPRFALRPTRRPGGRSVGRHGQPPSSSASASGPDWPWSGCGAPGARARAGRTRPGQSGRVRGRRPRPGPVQARHPAGPRPPASTSG